MLSITDFTRISLPFLKRLCKNLIPYYYRLNKKHLFAEYNRYLAAKVIQKWYRRYFYNSAIDSITFDPISYPCFVFCIFPGKFFFYSYDSIIKYIMKSGKTIDPCTRSIYSNELLDRLDQSAKIHFPDKNYKSTLKIKNSENYAKRIINRENEIMAYQTRMDHLKESILELLNNGLLQIPLHDVLIESVNYHSLKDYFTTILNELKILFMFLKKKDPWSASVFKESFENKLETFPEILITVQKF